MRILIVEDNEYVAYALAQAMRSQRYVADVVTDGETAWLQLQSLPYDLMLLDIMLPKLDGITLCQRARSQGYQLPILLITALDTTTDKVQGLDAGADDYVVKPIDLQELLARVRALLRRQNLSGSPILAWGELQLDPSTYEVAYRNQPLHLTPKEYAILEILLRNGRRVLSRSVLIDHVWSLEDPPGEDTVKAHIKSLRYKLKAVQAPDDFIETVYGVGYRLKQVS